MRPLYLLYFIVFCQLGHAFVYLNTARIAFYNERDFERAKKACLDGIKQGKEHYELYAILGGSEIGLGNWQNASDALIKAFAIDSLKTIEWMSEKGGGVQYYYQTFFFSARELFDQGNYEGVLKYLRYAQLVDPGDVGIYILRGATFSKMDSTEAAKREYEKALAIDPENPDVHFLIGKSLFETEAFDSSLSYFGDAIKYYEITYNRKTLILFQNLVEVSKELMQKMVQLWAEQKAEELDRLLKTDLGFDEGLDVHQQTIELFYKAATDLARSHYLMGMAYYYLGKDSLGLSHLQRSLESNPIDTDALYFTGELLVKFQAYEDAVEYLQRLTELKSDDLYAWFYLGVCYTQLKDYKKAADVYENKVLQLDPEYIDAMTNLAFIYSELGDKEKSLEYIRRVNELKKQKE